MPAWEWFHSKMDPLVSLEIMISIETLRTLITFEWTIIWRWLLLVPVHLQMCSVTAIEGRYHASHAVDELHIATWAVKIGHDGP